MTTEEKKRYIIQHWRTSSGSKISEMLKKYFLSVKEDKIAQKQLFLNPKPPENKSLA